jgi:hypothetical protein
MCLSNDRNACRPTDAGIAKLVGKRSIRKSPSCEIPGGYSFGHSNENPSLTAIRRAQVVKTSTWTPARTSSFVSRYA